MNSNQSRNVFNPQPEPTQEAAPVSTLPPAWQPFTVRGVAAFACTSYQRLFWIQVFFAALCAGTIVWALHYAWTPVIRSAVRNLPNEAPVRTEQLVYPPSAPPVLAESRHLAVLLQPSAGATASDVRFEFYPRTLRSCSLLGCLVWAYPKNQAIYLTRQEAIPWWDAWEPNLFGIIAIASALCFLALWSLLATIFFLPVRLCAYFADRQLTLRGSWQLSAAAFLPGSLALIAALILYVIGTADLIHFLIAVPGHLLIGIACLALAPRKLDRITGVLTPSANPFTAAAGHDKTSA
jgi:hypothetical protein